MTTIDLIIPSYRRPDDLAKALAAALAQVEPFHRIIVVARREDDATLRVAHETGLTPILVDEPGVLAAMTAGVLASTADIVAFTDDDAQIAPTHSQLLAALFASDTAIAGVGGPDVLYDGVEPRPTSRTRRVGQLTWWGRLIGNHHRGGDVVRDVVVLKGVNAAYRRELLRLPHGLRGEGAQPHFEVAIGTDLIARGYRLLYTTDLVVRHTPAPRRDHDDRLAPSSAALADSAYNLERSIPRRLMTRRLIYVVFMGDANVPGIGRLLVAAVRGEWSLWRRAKPAWRGTVEAWRERHQPLRYLGQ
jgi:glycosyltransferase involved in cell wall biosynthesis